MKRAEEMPWPPNQPMLKPADMVAEFYWTVGTPSPELAEDILRKEWDELDEAMADTPDDLVALANELADVVYTAYGYALTRGIDLEVALSLICEANMRKLHPTIYRDETGKILKPPGWEAADLTSAIVGELS